MKKGLSGVRWGVKCQKSGGQLLELPPASERGRQSLIPSNFSVSERSLEFRQKPVGKDLGTDLKANRQITERNS